MFHVPYENLKTLNPKGLVFTIGPLFEKTPNHLIAGSLSHLEGGVSHNWGFPRLGGPICVCAIQLIRNTAFWDLYCRVLGLGRSLPLGFRAYRASGLGFG